MAEIRLKWNPYGLVIRLKTGDEMGIQSWSKPQLHFTKIQDAHHSDFYDIFLDSVEELEFLISHLTTYADQFRKVKR